MAKKEAKALEASAAALGAEPRAAKTWTKGELVSSTGMNALEQKAENALTTANDAKTKAEAACPKTQAATKTALGLVKQSALVPEAAGAQVTKEECKALLDALKAAGIMASA